MKKPFFTIGILVFLFSCKETPKESPQVNNTTNIENAPPPPPVMDGDTSKNPDMVDFAAEVDSNKDGQLSREEWVAKGLPTTSFDGFEKGRGFVTLEDYQKNPAPPGIDMNGDGKLTVEEFKEFDKMMSSKMKK